MSQQTDVPVVGMNRRQRRSYDAARRETKDYKTEIELKATKDDGSEVREIFVARPGRVPGAVLVDFMRLGVYHDSEAMWEYFRCAFGEDVPTNEDGSPKEGAKSEYERFREFVRSPEYVVEAEVLSQIIGDMIEDASGFPTTPPAR